MGEDGSHSGNQGLKNKEWSLFWGKFVEDEVSTAVNNTAQVQLEKVNDMSQSLSLHKKLLDVEMENIHKEIEDLAIKLSQENRQSAKALEIRKRLKDLFLVEENLNIQLDLLQNRMSQTQQKQNDLIKGVS